MTKKLTRRICPIIAGIFSLWSYALTQAANPTAIVAVGTSVTFSVTNDGSGPFTYQWKKGGAPIIVPILATSATYTINSVQSGDAGSYSVTVANALNSITSDTGTITVQSLVITTQPSSQTIAAGAGVTFTVVVSGSPAPTFQWQKNGATVSGATSASLTLANIQQSDVATYTVVATNNNGSATSNGAVLSLMPPTLPAFTTQPASQTVTTGGSVTFTAAASGSPIPTFQWQKNGTSIGGATSASLTLTNVQLSDGASYTVVATNIAGPATSNAAVLTVQTAPVAPTVTVPQPASQTVAVGSTATITATVTGSPTPTLQWKKGNSNVSGQTSATLTLTNVQTSQAATYKLVATNTAGSATSSGAVLTVTTAKIPVFTTQPLTQTVASGTTLTLTAAASGPPAPTFQWKQNGTNITGATLSSLTLNNLTATNTGTYTVVATNSAGSATSNGAVLTVTTATVPFITTQPVSQTLAPGASVTFTAATSGTPAPTLQWQKNGANIAGATGPSLTLNNVTALDAGSYTLSASNSAGTIASNSAVLTISSPQLQSISTLFSHVLLRQPTAAELATNDAALTSGRTPAQILGDLLASAEYQSRQLEAMIRMYHATFLRIPDYPGLLSWSETLRTGAGDLVGVGSAFAGSAEFVSDYGSLSNTDFVQLFYLNVLGRGSDPGGLAYWVGLLDAGAPRGQILLGFSESDEFKLDMTNRVEIIRLYVILFGRVPSVPEIITWLNIFDGSDQTDIFQTDSRFLALFPGGGTNDQFVQTVFRGILRRDADAGTIANYSPALASGPLTRTQFLQNIFDSFEAQSGSVTVTRFFKAALGRLPTSLELDNWTIYLGGGNPLQGLADDLVTHTEFTSIYNGLSNQDYIVTLFQNVIGHAADAASVANWKNQLDSLAETRAMVLRDIVQTVESAQLYAPDVHTSLLSLTLFGVQPTATEAAFWDNYFITLPEQIRGELLANPEYH